MTYNALESSLRSGQPVELFRISYGATVYFLTSGDAAIVYLSDTYSPEAISRGRVKENEEADTGSVIVTLPRTHPLAAPFVQYSPEPALTMLILSKHRTDPETIELFRGAVSSVRFVDGKLELTCLPEIAALDHPVPRNTCQGKCNWALYSAQCGISKVAFELSGTVNAAAGDTLTATVFGSQASGWLNAGWVERMTGERRFVVNHVGSVVTLLSPFPGIVPGEAVKAYAGCDRTQAVCSSKFSNHTRFLGFPYVPTKNPFDVGVS